MPTLRRILKYTPAVVLGMLVIAWILNSFGNFGVGTRGNFGASTRSGRVDSHYTFTNHSIWVSQHDGNYMRQGWFWRRRPKPSELQPGIITSPRLSFTRNQGNLVWQATVPIVLAATLLLPLAIGPFISFRFRLWHYMAFTALVAVELAYYLRWQD